MGVTPCLGSAEYKGIQITDLQSGKNSLCNKWNEHYSNGIETLTQIRGQSLDI